MRTLFMTIAAALSISSGPANANGWTPASSVVGLDVGDSNRLYIRFADVTQCGTHIIFIPRAAPYYADALAIALSSLSTGKKLTVWIAACDGANPPEAVRIVNGTVW